MAEESVYRRSVLGLALRHALEKEGTDQDVASQIFAQARKHHTTARWLHHAAH